ncbi:hypothetical protein Pmani_030581 [Petrolisthes manimaculis]|uniref:Uncharacterized protein n=1 Tax=Petrolisthes manimaculis TaxID=1843537 RepID=A0AAE1NXL2_9EUCA|nr:hypothetical protein Pmani_030581 [Petrolisthes manimaculis]
MAPTTSPRCIRCQPGDTTATCAVHWAQMWRLLPPPLDGGLPSQPEQWGAGESLTAVLLEFSEGFAELLGVSVRRDKLYALVKRSCSKIVDPQLTPRPVLCRTVGRFKKPLAGCLPRGDIGGVGGTRPPPPLAQATAARSGGVVTQTPLPTNTGEDAPTGEFSPPSSSQATQPDGGTPKDLDLNEAFLVQPKKKGSPTAPTTQMLDAHFAARDVKIKRPKQ